MMIIKEDDFLDMYFCGLKMFAFLSNKASS